MCFGLTPGEGIDGLIQTRITIYPSNYLQSGNNRGKHQFAEVDAKDFMALYRSLIKR